MTKGGQMDAKLVSPSGAWIQQHMGSQFTEAMIDLIFHHRCFGSSRMGREFFPFLCITADSHLNEPVSFFGHARNQRFVDPRDRVLFELSREATMSVIRLGDHHHAGWLFVQPMNQPWPLF